MVDITVGGRGVVGLAVGGKEVECLTDEVKVKVVPAVGEWVWRWVRPKKKV